MTERVIDPFLIHLDDLKARRSLSDADLVDVVGLPNIDYLSKIRGGEKSTPTNVKFKVWSLLGNSWSREDMLTLLPEKFRGTLNAMDNKP